MVSHCNEQSFFIDPSVWSHGLEKTVKDTFFLLTTGD